MSTRAATHSNSWYTGNKDTLNTQLEGWLSAVGPELEGVGKLPPDGARVIIAPHAGYSYSGPAAAWAYKSLDISNAKRVFVLGPSHHVYLDRCDLSECRYYSTPLGNLTLDTDVLKEIHESGEKFGWMSLETDENEHSIEMHLPYIYKVLDLAGKVDTVKVVPIMVGAINTQKEKAYGQVLAKYLRDPENVFVISSDFCHWGTRFSYTHYYSTLPTHSNPDPDSTSLDIRSKTGPHKIHESIEALDRLGMSSIETGSHDHFAGYVKKTHNTICGRHPIGVIMAAIEVLQKEDQLPDGKGGFKFVRYEQSSKVKEPNDSSVSYASAFAVV
ncbi:UPF0103-domain-containing protein [Wilcoxina mikolae CBS 423.85]|nr:UPF0103-domain-containing protein [Wilcoxina mikolae CBS 423.85]